MSKSSSDKMDQDEKKILFELVKNSNENIEIISKRCGFSRQKTWRMIKQLEAKKLIWGYTAVFDEQKIGQTHFILMIKRTMEKIEEKVVDIIISTETEDIAKKLRVTIESNAYLHGEYDWMLTIIAKDIKQAKSFSDKLIALYPVGTDKIAILQTLMFIRKNYVLNPDRKNLKNFL